MERNNNPPDIDHQTCPRCGHHECTSIWIREDGAQSFMCHSCGETGWMEEPVDMTPDSGNSPPVENDSNIIGPYVPKSYRGISRNTMEKEGVYFTKNSTSGKETVHHPYPDGAVKHRELPKTIRVSGKMDQFQGADKYSGGNSVTITEGEEDRLSVIEMMGNYPVLNLPNASPSRLFWENARTVLSSYKKIVLSVDNDEAGDKVARQIYLMFPDRVYRVNHGSYKDANAFLEAGAVKQYRDAWWNATRMKPDNILSSKDDFLDLFHNTPEYSYFSTGIPELDNKMLGIHKGALTVILAETGIGKTEFFRYLEWRCLDTTDYKIAFDHGEETQLRSILGLLSYYAETKLIRKEDVESKGYLKQFEEFLDLYATNERMFQFNIRVDEGVDEIVEQVRFLSTAMGVDYIFIEPIQDFVSAANTTEKESLLTDLTNKLKRLAPELDVGIVIIAHTNKEGEAKYAASISQGAAYEIRLTRNPDAEEEWEKNRTYIAVGRKNRTGGGSGPAGAMDFDHDSFMLMPVLPPKEPEPTILKEISHG